MRTFLCFVFLFFCFFAVAQFGEEKIISQCTLCSANDIAAIDVTGDDLEDILVAAPHSEKIFLFENLGDFQFALPSALNITAASYNTLSLGDINNDGKEDVIAGAESGANILKWLEHDRNGSFTEHIIPNTTSVNDIKVVDLDGDSDLDILVSAISRKSIIWYENIDHGNSWEEHVIVTMDPIPSGVEAVDVDKDGDLDVFYSSGQGKPSAVLYWNDGQGIFSDHQILYDVIPPHRSVFTGDLDNDGQIDLFTCDNGASIFRYEYIAANKFDFTRYSRPNHYGGIQTGLIIDMDEDGKNDFFPSNYSEKHTYWYKYVNGTFQERIIPATNQSRLAKIIPSDLDKDGDSDFIGVSSYGDKIVLFKNNGAGNIIEENILEDYPSAPRQVLIEDLDHDGDNDIICQDRYDLNFQLYENSGKGNFKPTKIISNKAKDFNQFANLQVADFDQDTLLDLLVSDQSIVWRKNDGSNNFTEEVIIDNRRIRTSAIIAVDMDNDGDVDVVGSSREGTGAGVTVIKWFENQEKGTSWIIHELPYKGESNGLLAVEDYDLDGDKDIFAFSATDYNIVLFENDGTGAFDPPREIANTLDYSPSRVIEDLNGDGYPDVILTHSSPGRIAWYKNTGETVLSDPIIIHSGGNTPDDISIFDLNGDGLKDIVWSDDRKLYFNINIDNDKFSESIKIVDNPLSEYDNLYPSDLDEDGDIDLLFSYVYFDKIGWHNNQIDYTLNIHVFEDTNLNCKKEENEKGIIREVEIQSLPSQETLLIHSDEAGIVQYWVEEFSQDTTIEIRLLDAPNRVNSCPTTFQINTYEEAFISLPVQLESCPTLIVDIATPLLRRCFDNVYTVQYCNNSSFDIGNGRVDIQLDSFFSIINSDLPYEDKGADQYEFTLPIVESGNCGDFQFIINLSCQASLGQTHCVEAHIFPDSICNNETQLWSGASLKVAATCEQGAAKFTISNEGKGDMLQKQSLIIVEDLTIVKEREIRLEEGAIETIILPATGATYHAYIDQVPDHPGRNAPIAYVEGCGGINTTGLVNAFPQDDNDQFIAIDCQENIGAFDPNDKAATPVGIEAEHYLASNTDIKYKIRFQNTGTDTAFNIVIWDTLSPHLNPATLEAGVASHPYQFDRFQDTITGVDRIRFTFSNIMLPDSNINEAASHGFVQFRLQQQPDLSDGSIIENQAAIYFDFNKPIFTNVVHHTIGLPLTRLAVSTIDESFPSPLVTITPNPFGDFITVKKIAPSTEVWTISIFDVAGRQVLSVPMQNDTQQISTTKLGKGLYFYRMINKEGQMIGNGKRIKQ